MRAYDFGRFRLDADAHLLYRDEKRVQLTPKAVDVLLTLVEHKGTPVTREELMMKVWSDAAVEEGTLSSHISLLRKTLGQGFIETIPKRGYRFAAEVKREGQERSLFVVLPFENLSGTKKNDAFSDGLTEEMITQLGRLNPERLGVIARTSAMTYKSTKKTIEQIGRELGVSHVLEGSVRRAANRVRISAQLIQVSDQTHVWADSYEGKLEDILSLQSNVAREVATQIQIRLLPSEPTRRVVPEAYEAYLQGRYLWNRRTERDLRASIRSFRTSIDKDPNYAPPYAGVADAYLSLMDMGYLGTLEGTQKARPMAFQALQLDESLAEAHISLGHAAFHEFDWSSARSEFLRGLELNPNSTTARFYYSNFLAAMGRLDEALAEAQQAKRLDPVSPAMDGNLTSMFWLLGRYAEAVAHAHNALAINPSYARAYEDLGRSFEQMGRLDEAIKAFRKAVSLSGKAHGSLASLAHAYAVAGKKSDALKILRQLQRVPAKEFVSSYDFALIFTGLGKYDEAFAWLDRACDERSPALPFVKSNPRLAPLRRDHRFQKVLQRVDLALDDF